LLPQAILFLIGQLKKFFSETALDAFYQVSFHLAEWLQRRRFLEIDQSETRIECGGQAY
jgi:hypothetical protein